VSQKTLLTVTEGKIALYRKLIALSPVLIYTS